MTHVLGKMVSRVWLAGSRYWITIQQHRESCEPHRCSDNTSKNGAWPHDAGVSPTSAASMQPSQKLWITSRGPSAHTAIARTADLEATSEARLSAHIPCPSFSLPISTRLICPSCAALAQRETMTRAFVYLPPSTIWRPILRRLRCNLGGDDEKSSARLLLLRAAPARRHSGNGATKREGRPGDVLHGSIHRRRHPDGPRRHALHEAEWRHGRRQEDRGHPQGHR